MTSCVFSSVMVMTVLPFTLLLENVSVFVQRPQCDKLNMTSINHIPYGYKAERQLHALTKKKQSSRFKLIEHVKFITGPMYVQGRMRHYTSDTLLKSK